jgi:hypothetical protein
MFHLHNIWTLANVCYQSANDLPFESIALSIDSLMVAEDPGFDSREAKYLQQKRTTKTPVESLIAGLLPKVHREPDRIVGLLARSDGRIFQLQRHRPIRSS